MSGKDFVLVKRNHLYLPDRVCRLVPHCFFLRLTKQRSSAHRSAFSIHHSSRKVLSSAVSHGGSGTVQASACLRPPVLDESLIREQTKVDHFWGELSLVMSPVVLRRRGVVASLSLCPFLVGAAQGYRLLRPQHQPLPPGRETEPAQEQTFFFFFYHVAEIIV